LKVASVLDSHVGEFDVRVHTANTCTFGDLEENETLVTPASAPRVLNLPVVIVAILILLEHSAVFISIAGVPPLVDGAARDGVGLRLRLRIRVGVVVVVVTIVIVLLCVADEDDGVIETSWAAIVGTDNTRSVMLEVTTAGIDSNSHWLLLQLVLDLLEAVAGVDPRPAGDLADNLVRVVRAISLSARISRSVRIIFIKHDTMLGLEVPGSGHPATTAAPKAEVLAEEFLITCVVAKRAVNKVLLGEADGSL